MKPVTLDEIEQRIAMEVAAFLDRTDRMTTPEGRLMEGMRVAAIVRKEIEFIDKFDGNNHKL